MTHAYLTNNQCLQLAAVASAASKDTARPVLTKVHLASDGEGSLMVEATDSYMAVRREFTFIDGEHPERADCLYDAKQFGAAMKQLPKQVGRVTNDAAFAQLAFEETEPNRQTLVLLVHDLVNQMLRDDSPDCSYPNIQKIWDEAPTFTEQNKSFNPEKVAQLFKTIHTLPSQRDNETVEMVLGEKGPSHMSLNSNDSLRHYGNVKQNTWKGLLMPVKGGFRK